MGPFSQSQWPSWAYSGLEETFPPYTQLPNYPTYLADSMETYQNHHSRHLVHHHMSRATESKPRLSKEEVEVLEAEFQKNHKPSSSTKKALAESMRVDNARINNWFQNRRAREKKENNIREYEARQRLEKEKAEADSGSQPDTGRQCDLVASSAPFPQPRGNARPHADAPRSPSPMSLPDACSEITDPSQRCESGSPALSTSHSRSVTPSSVTFSSGLVKPHHSNTAMAGELSDQDDGFLNVSDLCANETPHGLPMEASHLFLSLDTKVSEQPFGGYQGFLGSEVEQHGLEALEQGFGAAALPQHSPVSDDSSPTSPQTSDVASRRDRRPPPLATGECRSHSYYTPRTSMDPDRRGGRASPLRRVASSTGSSRVRKSVATPRSPFYDGTADISLHTRCSAGSRAPPTPDTPVALHQQVSIDGALTYSLDRKYISADMALQDPTLRTPPSTPGFMESLFSMGSGYDMSISEESLISPGIARLPGGFDMSSVTGDMSDFVGSEGACPNEQPPPLLPSQMGHAYFGGSFLGSTLAGYDWPDVSTPTTSSPGLQHGQPGF